MLISMAQVYEKSAKVLLLNRGTKYTIAGPPIISLSKPAMAMASMQRLMAPRTSAPINFAVRIIIAKFKTDTTILVKKVPVIFFSMCEVKIECMITQKKAISLTVCD